MNLVYLDNNATTRPADDVIVALDDAMRNCWGNPSSIHRFGQSVRQRVELARASLAKLIGTRPRHLLLTSGGTESNNLALRGSLPKVLLTTKTEHAAIREPADALAEDGVDVRYLALSENATVTPKLLSETLASIPPDVGRVLLSIQWANNETGILQPIEQLADVVQQARDERDLHILFHVDATQAVGKLPVNCNALAVDLLTFATHKFHGPKGVGGLYVKRGIKLKPQQLGGPQETEKRGGTENAPNIIAAGVAADLAIQFVEDETKRNELAAKRDRFEAAIVERIPRASINGKDAPRLWNTSNIAFANLEAEAILLGLSERNICASAGAACSSGSLEPSPVLLAMGIPEEKAHGSVRFSLSRDTTDAELDAAIEGVGQVVTRLAKTLPI